MPIISAASKLWGRTVYHLAFPAYHGIRDAGREDFPAQHLFPSPWVIPNLKYTNSIVTEVTLVPCPFQNLQGRVLHGQICYSMPLIWLLTAGNSRVLGTAGTHLPACHHESAAPESLLLFQYTYLGLDLWFLLTCFLFRENLLEKFEYSSIDTSI